MTKPGRGSAEPQESHALPSAEDTDLLLTTIRSRIAAHRANVRSAATTSLTEGMSQAGIEYDEALAAIDLHVATKRTKLLEHRESTLSAIKRELAELLTSLSGMGDDWTDPAWKAFSPTHERRTPGLVRIGTYRLSGESENLDSPALLPLLGSSHLLFKAKGEMLAPALVAMQSLVLRTLASLPPGKLRLIMIDPVGLGSNMAGFLRLPELLTGGRSWQEHEHIESQLAKLTTHMATVIQKYLLNRFDSIESYNQDAGEISEPYRLVMSAMFPVGFTEQAAQRLVSIASNGVKTGVHIVLVQDTEAQLPHGFSQSDLERLMTVVEDTPQGFAVRHDFLRTCQLSLDRLPETAVFNHIVTEIGTAAEAAAVVRLPFDSIRPAEEMWWSSSTAAQVTAPIGRAGAYRVQNMELGRGTAQHVMIAGRTGSGKSNLLHTLCLTLSMTYSPRELELYLIDFKKGIEFKDYATHCLPHARVVAVQSEREFGHSVLELLDFEMQHRGDLFRGLGVTSMADYRGKKDVPNLPRIVLIVDEFHEFFAEDDALAGRVSLVLDRLVRQGRAFGMHVVLASQSLAGSYSLPRSTLEQIAVRIALQCDEANSRIVLGDDNPGARYLTRTGEAIYNSENGLIERNSLFQVAYLAEDERTEWIRRIRDRAVATGLAPESAPVVFEGKAFTRVEDSRTLRRALDGSGWPEPKASAEMWLGDPVAIRPTTSVVLLPQSRSNMVVVGLDESTTTGMLTASLISLAARRAPAHAAFHMLNLTSVDGPWHGLLSDVFTRLPHASAYWEARNASAAIAEIHEIVSSRLDHTGGLPSQSIYFLLAAAQRCRVLRTPDPFDPSEVGEQLQFILREGPSVGVHTILTVDTVPSLERSVGRGGLMEFGARVALQMNATDSHNFIDCGLAAKLDSYSALLSTEERTGDPEKFRPFSLPTRDWCEAAIESLRARAGGESRENSKT